MSALLHLLRSFGPRARCFRQSEEDRVGPERSATLVHDLDAPESETKSNRFGRHLPAGPLLDRLPWQVRASARITLLGPPTASLILLAVFNFKHGQAVPFNLADFLLAFLLFAIPAGYAFGAVPALLAASLYCALLTADPRLLQWRLLTRAGLGAICGGLVGSLWFRELLHVDWGIYGLTGALAMVALSLGSPSTGEAARRRNALMSKESRPRLGLVEDL